MIAVGTKMPAWVEAGFSEYAKRLSGECRLSLVEIPAFQRSKSSDPVRAVREEGERILKAIPKGAWVVALDVLGAVHSTESLAQELKRQMSSGRDLALLIGGADGLSPEVLEKANESWSLSRLTFPHPLVRVLVAEQFYRAYTVCKNHPYHRF